MRSTSRKTNALHAPQPTALHRTFNVAVAFGCIRLCSSSLVHRYSHDELANLELEKFVLNA